MDDRTALSLPSDPSPLSPEGLLAFLDALGIRVEVHAHPPLHTVEESRALRGLMPGGHTKNLFLKDRKGGLWLVVALEDTAVDLKRLEKRIGSARLSFARPELLWEALGVRPGSVTPFALANDRDRRVRLVLERAMLDHDLLNYHPLTNDRTAAIARADLMRFFAATGHEPMTVELD
jgi:Ala-tRNA(Pro) deacylase